MYFNWKIRLKNHCDEKPKQIPSKFQLFLEIFKFCIFLNLFLISIDFLSFLPNIPATLRRRCLKIIYFKNSCVKNQKNFHALNQPILSFSSFLISEEISCTKLHKFQSEKIVCHFGNFKTHFFCINIFFISIIRGEKKKTCSVNSSRINEWKLSD
jgi:hypothetical protein